MTKRTAETSVLVVRAYEVRLFMTGKHCGTCVETKAWKNRVPFRPLAILRSKADVLDVHFYCENELVFEEDLASIEFKAVCREARERGVVLVAGEFGAFKRGLFTSANAAAEWISKVVPLLGQAGFGGWLYWTYDTHEQDAELWHACSGDGSIYKNLMKPALALEPPRLK